MPTDVRELVDATLLFLDRHEEALHSGVPSRALEACDSLHSGLCTTLAQQVGAAHNELGGAGIVEPASSRAFVERLSRTQSDPREHEAWAMASLRKRMAEAEGVLLHLRLTLSKGSADGPALSAYTRRLHTEANAATRTLDALRGALQDWAASTQRLRGNEPDQRTNRGPADARAMTRAARECLVAGVPNAAAPLLRAALARARADAPSPIDESALDAILRRLDADPLDDPVLMWRLLDFVEYAANVAGMPASAVPGRS
ncbi:MAG: hypothetical protein WDA16_11045 [Candidatus Thermoplasmatota archaeon]